MTRYRKAFTLIEMVIVITILGILAIMAIPRLMSFSSLRLTGAAYKLASDIKYAQQLSISRQVMFEIVFNPWQNSYFITENYPTPAIDPLTRQTMVVDYDTDSTYKNVKLDHVEPGSLTILQFDPWGNPYDSTTLLQSMGKIFLSYQGKTKIISITPHTGHVEIQ